MKAKYLLSSLLILSMFNTLNTNVLKAQEQESEIDVGKATTLEEKVDIALREITLNTDLNNVVTDILVPTSGLYESSFTWTSSDNSVAKVTSGRIKITRPALGQQAKQVTLTVKAKIVESREVFLEKSKDYVITVLPIDEEISTTKEEFFFSENFSTYPVGEDVGEYLSWKCSTNDSVTSVVDSIPNNNLINNQKALKINSMKTSKNITYTRELYTTSKFAVEAYVLFYGQINGIYFSFGKGETYGPSIGFTHENILYANNGYVSVDTNVNPINYYEGVWNKFRLEINTKTKDYTLKMYKMNNTSETYTIASDIPYDTTLNYFDNFQIKATSGANVGQVYLSNLKIDYAYELNETTCKNPNRTNGIGRIENFDENVLFINGSDENYNDNIKVYNRFDPTKLYVLNKDYTMVSEKVSETEKLDQIKHIITLTSTKETKQIIQNIYKEDANGTPYIDSFKSSHLARYKLSNGNLSTTGNITFKGLVTRNDGTLYYGLADHQINDVTASSIKNSSLFVKSGSFEQTERNISYTIIDLPLNKEYFLYVVMENSNGTSEVYNVDNITEVINIETCEDFYNMTIDVTTFQNKFRLLNDLDFSNYDWISDPSNALKWEGELDGQGYTISNLTIDSTERKAALFYEITNATIKNINFDNCNIYGLQDSAVVAGYSNGGTIENIKITNSSVNYNNIAGSEGYFAMVVGRLHKDTTTMTNIIIDNCNIDCNKYTGALTGNVNKGNNCVLNAKNIYVDMDFTCDGAAIGLVGRNRGTTTIENCVAYLNVKFAKKEMGVVVGHNKEGGVLKVKNLIGTIEVREVTQPTYFNNMIGSQDDSTSKYSFENVYFFECDYSHISESITPMNNTRSAGVILSQYDEHTEQWWEENTFISCFETDEYWVYNSKTQRPELVFNKEIIINADMVNEHINQIKDNNSEEDHYHIYQAYQIYNKLTDAEKAKVNIEKLNSSKEKYDRFIDSIKDLL